MEYNRLIRLKNGLIVIVHKMCTDLVYRDDYMASRKILTVIISGICMGLIKWKLLTS